MRFRHFVLPLFALLLFLAGCKKSTQESAILSEGAPVAVASDDDVRPQQTEMNIILERQAVLERVKDIFRVVKGEFFRRGSSVENELLDKAYCSKDWNSLLLAVRYKEYQTNTLFFEINRWSLTTEPGVVWFDEFEVTSLVPGPKPTASVSFVVYEDNTYTPAKLDLVYENGQWMIDNFYNLKYGLNLRERMWYYLENDMM